MNIKEELRDILNEYGIAVTDNGKIDGIDSITFVSLIVELEEVYNINFPDELLMLEAIRDIDNLATIIEQQMEE